MTPQGRCARVGPDADVLTGAVADERRVVEAEEMIHTHVAARAIEEARRRLLTRRCPKCRLEQLTPEEALHVAVACERCSTPIRPKGSGGTGADEGGSL